MFKNDSKEQLKKVYIHINYNKKTNLKGRCGNLTVDANETGSRRDFPLFHATKRLQLLSQENPMQRKLDIEYCNILIQEQPSANSSLSSTAI